MIYVYIYTHTYIIYPSCILYIYIFKVSSLYPMLFPTFIDIDSFLCFFCPLNPPCHFSDFPTRMAYHLAACPAGACYDGSRPAAKEAPPGR